MAIIKNKTEMLSLQKKFGADQEIGDHFSVSRQAIHQLRNKFGVPAISDLNKERNLTIKKMRKSGRSAESISNRYGLSISQVYRIFKK